MMLRRLVCTAAIWTLATHVALAETLCVNLSDGENVAVKATRTDNAGLQELQKRMDAFIDMAKKSNAKDFDKRQLITQYSRMDASQSHIAKELGQIPDKFSLYPGIQRADIISAFDWGKYKIAVVQYDYQGQVAEEAQAFFCSTGGCRISNLLERGEAPEDIALRFIHRLKFTNWQGTNCPAGTSTYAIAPSIGPSAAGDPLQVYVNYAFAEQPKQEGPVQPDAQLKVNMGNFYRCVEQARQHNTDDLYADTSHSAVREFLGNCTLNMDIGTMVPALRGSNLAYLPPISLISVLQDGNLKPLGSVTENGVNYKVFGIKNAANAVSTVIVLPLVSNGSVKLDWNYFERDLSYLLLTPEFKRILATS